MSALHTVLADEESHVARAQRKVESVGKELRTSLKKVRSTQQDVNSIDEDLERKALAR
jgi:hypothetical protein